MPADSCSEAPLDAVEPPSHPHDTERIVEGREQLRLVLKRLDNLSEDRREALIMRLSKKDENPVKAMAQ